MTHSLSKSQLFCRRLLLLKKAFEDTEERMASADTITTRILHQNKICLDDARALCREYDNATLAVFGSFKLCGVVKKQHLTFPLP